MQTWVHTSYLYQVVKLDFVKTQGLSSGLTESDVIEPACIGKLLLLRLIKQLLLGVSNF